MAAPEPGVRNVSRRFLAIALLVATSCGSSTAHASKVSPSPSGSPSAIVTVLPTDSPTGPSDPPVTPVGFKCRLPVVTSGGEAGFISFPAAAYAADPSGASAAATQSFDVPANRWVPVPLSNVAPDGSSYAYADGPAIHVVTAATSADKGFPVAVPNVGTPTGIEVMEFDGAHAYFVVTQAQGYPIGAWRLDTGSGKVATLARVNGVMAVQSGYAWAGTVDPHDTNAPVSPSGQALFDTVVQVNVGNGAQTPWYHTLGRSADLLGFASGDRPIVAVSYPPDFTPSSAEIRLIDDSNTSGGENNGELVSPGGLGLMSPQADADRVWFGGARGIYLYTGAGLQKVFAYAAGGTGNGIRPAGACR